MSNWLYKITKEAENDIDNLDRQIRDRVLEKLKWMAHNFENIIPFPLGGEWRGFFKLRVGDWRIIYEIDLIEKTVIIHHVNHRNKVYKRRRK